MPEIIEPRVFALCGNRSQEIPLRFLRQRRENMPGPGYAADAIEIAPGVKVRLLYTGDVLLPDGDVVYGAKIAVWGGHYAPSVDQPPS